MWNIFKSKNRIAKETAEIKREESLNILSKTKDLLELRLITINNIRFIESSMPTLVGMLNYSKGSGPGETRQIRKSIKSKIEWFKQKLPEEITNRDFFNLELIKLGYSD